MGWETDFTTSLAFRSLETPSQMDDQPSSNKTSERWDPPLASLLKHNNHNFDMVEPSSRGNFTTSSAPSMQPAPVFSTDEATAGLIGTAVTDSNSPIIHASATSTQLNAHSSVGAASTKVSKKRSRASRRPPTTVLEADSANFRSMVQHLTGIPAPPPMLSPSLHHSRYDFLGSGLIRPQPSRPVSPFGTGPGVFGPLESSASALLQYQSPYGLSRRMEDHYRNTLPYGSVRTMGSFLDAAGGMNPGNLHQGVEVMKTSSSAPTHVGGVPGGGFYVAQGGNSTGVSSGGLLMPSLWELETRDGESFNARVKREVGVEDAGSGRQIASSWSTSL